MKKLILLVCITLLTLAQAKVVNAIALVVNGETITTAEIDAVEKQLRVDKAKATELLIQDRLQKAAMKNIVISEDDIDAKVTQIAAQNSITIPKMQKILKEQGTQWSKYRASIKESMKKERFYQEKVVATITKPSEDELKLFYKNHKKDFMIPKTISMIEYSATSESTMKKFLQTKKEKGIKSRSVKKSTKNINAALLGTFLQTQDGFFTRPINAGDRYISYKILSKEGKVDMPFEAAQGAVAAKWKQQQQGKALKDYFEKMKSNAEIQIIRK